MKTFVFTCGDVNGIGPEICIKALNRLTKEGKDRFILLLPENILCSLKEILPIEFDYRVSSGVVGFTDSSVIVIDSFDTEYDPQYGATSVEAGDISFKAIQKGVELCSSGIADTMITAPISKKGIQLAGHDFPGHTEMLAEWTGADDFVMTFVADQFRCALATIHEPIRKVSSILSEDVIIGKVGIVNEMLKKDFDISNPKIAVLGLNPHAGEDGKIGKEENEIIRPAIATLKKKGIAAEGPFVPDAFFGNHMHNNYDLIFGMYHDQVLIPFKMTAFNTGVNYTAGLPIVRTSPDHGTAFDIAGKGEADPESILCAFRLAKEIVTHRGSKG